MALIVLHLFNTNDQREIIVNTDHIVSVEGANEGSTNIQLTAGVHRVSEDRDTVLSMIGGAPQGLSQPVLETKSADAEADADPTETPAQRKARLKAEADAAKSE